MSLDKEKLRLLPVLPHGELKKVFENIWFVKGQIKMPMLLPMKISRSMTVVRNPKTNELTLINSMRLSDTGLAELEQFGKIANVVRVAGFHGRDDAFYRQRFNAKVYAIEGQIYSRKLDVPKEGSYGYMQADVYLNQDSQLPIEGASLKIFKSSSPSEAVIIIDQGGGILVAGDSLQNTPVADEFVNFPARLMMKKMGFYKPFNVGPGWLQFAKPSAEDVRSILDLEFNHVLPGHGDPVINDAKSKYRAALENPPKGCHD